MLVVPVKLLKKAKYSPKDCEVLNSRDINKIRLVSEKYYDYWEEVHSMNPKLTSGLSASKEIYSLVMQEYERVYT